LTNALLGCTWLILKPKLQNRLKALARTIALVLVATIAAVITVWTAVTHPNIAARWFSFPNIIVFSPAPVLVIAATWGDAARARKSYARSAIGARTGNVFLEQYRPREGPRRASACRAVALLQDL
jgi:cytochrome bd-type quinol oxidase subunit 2